MIGSKIDFSKQWEELQFNYNEFISSSVYRLYIYSTFTNIMQKNLYALKYKAEFEHKRFVTEHN